MDNIEELISKIPIIISYVAYGAVFLSLYNFLKLKESKLDTKSYLVSCLTISYIIRAITRFILSPRIADDSTGFILVGILISVVSAYLFGIVSRNKRFNKFLLKIGIERTVSGGSFWDDVIDSYTWLLMHINGEEYGYLGEVVFIEENTSVPKFLLQRYQKIDIHTGDVIEDYSENFDMKIVIDSKKSDIIEVIYTSKESPTKEKLRELKSKVVEILNK